MAVIIEKTRNTPHVSFQDGMLEVTGRAIPEHAVDFFNPLVCEIQNYMHNPKPETVVQLRLEYANSGAKRMLMDICILFEKIHKSGRSNVIIYWHIEKEDDFMYELGKDLQELVEGVDINIVEY